MKLSQGGIEVISLETVDGERLPLKGAWLDYGFSGFGAAPIQWQTQTGYKRNGAKVIDYRLTERRLNVIVGESETNEQRYEYWNARSKLLEFLRPNRGDFNEITLTLSRLDADGLPVKRSIRCVYNGGAEMEDFDEDSNQFRVNLALEFVAFDPLFFDPVTVDLDLVATTQTDLIFPITFPILFGASGNLFDTGDLNYTGSWRAYPTITITGPYSSAVLTDYGTGATITLGVAIGAGETRIIALSENSFMITDGNGNNAFDELTVGSNLIGFYIPPTGQIIAGGEQRITVNLIGGSESQSAVNIEYSDTYYGI